MSGYYVGGIENDTDMIERALDAAEAKLAAQETEETVETDAPEVETESQESETSEDDVAQEAIVARDQRGKFVSKNPAAKAKQVSQGAIEPESTDVQGESLETQDPQGAVKVAGIWDPKERQVLAKAPREVQELIARREAQRAEWDKRIAREVEPAKAFLSRAQELFEPQRAKFQVNGVRDPIDAMGRLFAWNEIFENNPMLGIRDLMDKNGLSPYDFLQDESQQQPQGDPRLDEAYQRLQAHEETVRALQEKLEAQETAQGVAAIEGFKSGRDSFGNTRGQFFDAYKPQITEAFREITRIQPDMPEADRLHHAYEAILHWTRDLHGVGAAQPRMAAVPDASKARAAAKLVSGAPKGGVQSAPRPKAKGKDFDERLLNTIEKNLDSAGL
jgi:hypothetical protein